MKEFEDLMLKVKVHGIKELVKYFQMGDSNGLRELSNDLIEDAVVTENPVDVNLSLIAYALSKLVTKPHFFKSPIWEVFQKDLISRLSEINRENAGRTLDIIIQNIKSFDAETGNYIEDIIEKARVKQASRAYALGLSLGKAAELTQIDKAFLLSYIGFTKIHDRPFTQSMPTMERYKYIKELFGE